MGLNPGPNEPCPCGSGRKFKRCCHGSDAATMERRRGENMRHKMGMVALVGLALFAVLAAVVFVMSRTEPAAMAGIPVQLPPGSTPPGPAPPGQVWNVEHGHWHNAVQTPFPGALPPGSTPPGPAPPGQIWSPEHGHWHNLALPTPPG